MTQRRIINEGPWYVVYAEGQIIIGQVLSTSPITLKHPFFLTVAPNERGESIFALTPMATDEATFPKPTAYGPLRKDLETIIKSKLAGIETPSTEQVMAANSQTLRVVRK